MSEAISDRLLAGGLLETLEGDVLIVRRELLHRARHSSKLDIRSEFGDEERPEEVIEDAVGDGGE